MSVAELDDVACRHRTDAVDRFEVLHRCAAEADRAVFGDGTRHRSASWRIAGHEDLLAVGKPRGQVDRFQRRVAAGASGAGDRIGDAGTGRQPVDPRAAHRSGHVDDDVRASGLESEAARPLRRPSADLPRLRVGGLTTVAGADRPGAREQKRDGDRAVDQQLRSAQVGHGHTVPGGDARVARALELFGRRGVPRG